MRTPKEEAEHLYSLFLPFVRLKMGQEDFKEKTKGCAKIAVQRIKETVTDINGIYYWEQVLIEIENL